MGSPDRPIDIFNFLSNARTRHRLAQNIQESPTLSMPMILARKHARRFLHSMALEVSDYSAPQTSRTRKMGDVTYEKQQKNALLFRDLISEGRIIPSVTTADAIGKPRVNGLSVTIPIGASRINEDFEALREDEVERRLSEFRQIMKSVLKLFSRHPNLRPYYADLNAPYSHTVIKQFPKIV